MKKKGLFRCAHYAGQEVPVLFPVNERAHEIMAFMYPDKQALIEVHAPRWIEHNALMWVALTKIAQCFPGQTPEKVLMYMLRTTGRFEWVELLDGYKDEVYQSIAFESMTQDEFRSFTREVVEVIRDRLRDRMPPDVYFEVMNMLVPQAAT